jgi:nucleoid DNA-binding protein
MRDNDELKFIGFGTFKAKQTEEKQVKTLRGYVAKVLAQRRISFSVRSEFKVYCNADK